VGGPSAIYSGALIIIDIIRDYCADYGDLAVMQIRFMRFQVPFQNAFLTISHLINNLYLKRTTFFSGKTLIESETVRDWLEIQIKEGIQKRITTR